MNSVMQKITKDHFDYIYSYAPYNNIKKMDYPHIYLLQQA